jgi:MerR family copper efflux transcriptional regulator
MKIGELGDQCAVTTKTIRYYESIGLLDEPSRTPSGYRDYGETAVERLQFIRDAQSSGVGLHHSQQ